jgi:hypothetical protein
MATISFAEQDMNMATLSIAEQDLNDCIRVVATHRWNLQSVPSVGPPWLDEHKDPNLAAMAVSFPTVMADHTSRPIAQARGHAPHWRAWTTTAKANTNMLAAVCDL